MNVKILAAAAALTLVAAGARAATATVPFPAAGDPYLSQTNGPGTIPAGGQTAFMWTTGDFVTTTQPISLASVSSISDTFQVQNFLGNGNNENVDVFVNAVDVGTFTVLDSGFSGADQTLTFSASFASIPTFGNITLAFVLDNTIPGGGGSIAFLDGGIATLTGGAGTPEPATWAMLILGVAGIGASLRGTRRRVLAA